MTFALYLPGVEMTLSAELYHAAVGERQMLFEHLQHLAADSLRMLDRRYPARWLIAHFCLHGVHFCIRVEQTGFAAVQAFLRTGAADDVVTRSGCYPAADFADLCHSRWRIEAAFKHLKHRLALENTSYLS